MATVLIVDDNEDICRVLARLVRASGHAADIVLGGQEAIDYCASHQPDMLILEGLNTAVEAAIDLASPQIHPLAKAAKDLAAGMVLIAAIASVAVGGLILGPPLWRKVFG